MNTKTVQAVENQDFHDNHGYCFDSLLQYSEVKITTNQFISTNHWKDFKSDHFKTIR